MKSQKSQLLFTLFTVMIYSMVLCSCEKENGYAKKEKKLRLALAKLIMDKPIFSEEWINMEAMSSIFFSDADTNEVHAHAASERMNIIRNLFHKG